MPRPAPRKRELGRGERVLPGVWRLRLPLPWEGVPHCNAWALAAGDGIVLVDCGMHLPGSLGHLERALEQVGLRLEHVRLLVCTHAHADHYGQAATVLERSGCELWMHRAHQHATERPDPQTALARRIEVARSSGVPEAAITRWAESRREQPSGLAGVVLPHAELVDGTTVDSDLGPWTVVETPGHAPSHVCLHQPGQRLLLSGDHLLGRVSLYFDHGWTPDPVGEFLTSLDRVEALDVRLCLAGHARPFADVMAHIEANRALVARRLEQIRALVAERPRTAFGLARAVYGQWFGEATAGWLMTKTLCYLDHLELRGEVRRRPEEGARERWSGVPDALAAHGR